MEKKMSESNTKVIKLPMPYKKQREILLDPHRFKVLNLGRRCVVGDSLVDMADGKQKKIKYIKVGDLVKTSVGPKRVVHTFRTYACPCPMLKLDIGGKIYETTYDHKYLTREGYVPAIIIAWGIMAASERKKFKLLCEQYGETVNDEIQRWLQNSGDETCERCEWIFANSNGWEDNKSSQGSSRDFCDESREQILRGPYRQQQSEQQSGKLTMGDTARERIIGERKGEACRRERGGEISECEDDGKTSISSIRVNGEIHTDIRKSSKNSKRSRSNVEPSTRYFAWENLEIRSATVGEYEEVYDITVEDVHNYSLNGLIVHNTGKSTLAACKAFLHAVETGYSSLIISDTMEHARDIYWNEILPQTIPEVWATKNENLLQYKIKPVKFDLPVAKFWGHDIHADYTAQTKTPLIKLKGVDKNPDALRGGKYGFIVVDEAAFAECDLNDVFRKVLRPMVADTGGEIWIVSTPNGTMNHFFTFATLAQNDLEPDWGYFHATALDNPYFDPKGTGEWESIKRAYERAGKIGDWQQEYMADFAQPESLVFPMFDPKIHIVKDIPDHEDFNHFIGVDFGWCLTGDTKILTKDGYKRVDKVGTKDTLFTKDGWEKVSEVSSHDGRECIKLDFDLGYNLRGAPQHKIWTENRDFIKFSDVKKGDILLWIPSLLWAKLTTKIEQATIVLGLEERKGNSTWKSTKCIKARLKKAMLYTILMGIRTTTSLKILFKLLRANTKRYTEILRNIVKKDGVKDITQEIKNANTFAKFAIKSLLDIHTLIPKLVVQNVHTNSLGKQKIWGIRTNGTIFANNICVHNNDPFAVVFIAVHPRSNTWFVYDEIYEQHTTSEDRIQMMKQKMGGDYFQYIVGDCADPTSIAELKKGGINVRPSVKRPGAKTEEYNVIRSQLNLRETQTADGIKLLPKMYISARCKNYINEIMGLAYKKNKWGELTDIVDERMPDHLLDATRYINRYMKDGGRPPKKAIHRYSKSGRRLD